MDHERLLPDHTEPVSDLEVRALVERFGERQTMASGQPTINDVAEGLQVDPATVSNMLVELRESKNQEDLKQRLDRLESENAELRDRTSESTVLHSPFTNANVRQPFMAAMVVSLVAVVAMTKGTFGQGGHFGLVPSLAALVLFAILFFVGRFLFRKSGS